MTLLLAATCSVCSHYCCWLLLLLNSLFLFRPMPTYSIIPFSLVAFFTPHTQPHRSAGALTCAYTSARLRLSRVYFYIFPLPLYFYKFFQSIYSGNSKIDIFFSIGFSLAKDSIFFFSCKITRGMVKNKNLSSCNFKEKS